MGLKTVSLTNESTIVEVVPERGAIVTRLEVAGRELLYLDRSTLEDPSKNVRGGIPLLFPFAGRLAGDLFTPAATTMKQHGFARNSAWTLGERHHDEVRLGLGADAATRAQYPYNFICTHAVRALPRGLALELVVENRDNVPLPVAPGWHPYFNCPTSLKGKLAGDVKGFDPTALGDDREFDFGLPAPQDGRARFELPELGRVTLSFNPDMRHLQFWSQPGKPFVCLEPFTGPPGLINSAARDDLPPGRARTYWMRIELG